MTKQKKRKQTNSSHSNPLYTISCRPADHRFSASCTTAIETLLCFALLRLSRTYVCHIIPTFMGAFKTIRRELTIWISSSLVRLVNTWLQRSKKTAESRIGKRAKAKTWEASKLMQARRSHVRKTGPESAKANQQRKCFEKENNLLSTYLLLGFHLQVHFAT